MADTFYVVQPLTKGSLPPFLRRFQALNDAYNLRLAREQLLAALVRFWCWRHGALTDEQWEPPTTHVLEYDANSEAWLIDLRTRRRLILRHGALLTLARLTQPLYAATGVLDASTR